MAFLRRKCLGGALFSTRWNGLRRGRFCQQRRVASRGRMVPVWLHALSSIYLAFGVVSAAIIALDLLRHPQHMWIMNIVWPVTALFGTAWIVWQYFSYGRLASRGQCPCRHAAASRSAKSHTDALHGEGEQRRFALRQRLHARRHRCGVAPCSPYRRSPWLLAGTGSFATRSLRCGLSITSSPLRLASSFNTSRSRRCAAWASAGKSSRLSKPTRCRSQPGRSACTASWPSHTSRSFAISLA